MRQTTNGAQICVNLAQFRTVALIALGANQPHGEIDVTETLREALTSIKEFLGPIRATSRFFRTPAFPPGSGPDFVNAAVAVDTELSPSDVLQTLNRIEADLGRRRRERWAPRTLDLDLIGLGDLVLPDAATHRVWRDMPLEEQQIKTPENLILPHPRMQERAFVLIPLADVASLWRHPLLDRTVSQMVDALPQAAKNEVVPLE